MRSRASDHAATGWTTLIPHVTPKPHRAMDPDALKTPTAQRRNSVAYPKRRLSISCLTKTLPDDLQRELDCARIVSRDVDHAERSVAQVRVRRSHSWVIEDIEELAA